MTGIKNSSGFGLFLLRAGLLIGAGIWIYSPVLRGGWLWDDDLYITQNALMHDPARLWKTWFEPGSLVNYFPITATAQWVEWELWGNDTLGYHLVNLGLHLLNSFLVWRLLAKFRLRLAWVGGLIFAIHPTAVESVAWICELKNTLSLVPLLMAMLAWIDHEESPSRGRYFLALGWFIVAMLCKTTGVMFPVVILLYAWWRRGRIAWNDLEASVPFFVVSLVLGAVTVFAEKHYFAVRLEQEVAPLGFVSQLACAGLAISFYFSNCFWPVGLMPIYPKWDVRDPSLFQYLPWAVLAVALGWLWWRRERFGRHVLLGLGYFLINLAPFMGFATSGYMMFTWVMDHFLYVPIIGLIGVTVAALEQIDKAIRESRARSFEWAYIAVIAGGLALLAMKSHRYARNFTNLETLWTFAAAERFPESAEAQRNFAMALLHDGRLKEAAERFEAVLRIDPNDRVAQVGLEQVQANLNK